MSQKSKLNTKEKGVPAQICAAAYGPGRVVSCGNEKKIRLKIYGCVRAADMIS